MTDRWIRPRMVIGIAMSSLIVPRTPARDSTLANAILHGIIMADACRFPNMIHIAYHMWSSCYGWSSLWCSRLEVLEMCQSVGLIEHRWYGQIWGTFVTRPSLPQDSPTLVTTESWFNHRGVGVGAWIPNVLVICRSIRTNPFPHFMHPTSSDVIQTQVQAKKRKHRHKRRPFSFTSYTNHQDSPQSTWQFFCAPVDNNPL
jgi:hypothetical protein